MEHFDYAEMLLRENWQKEYRYGAFYLFPPDGTIEAIDALRRQHDPKSASICQAHLSLSEPLLSPLTQAQILELQRQLSALEPFQLSYGPLRSFPPYPGVTYAIQPESTFMALRSAIHATSLFNGAEFRHAHIPPHMTIAEFITVERTAALLRELSGKVPEGAFLCREIEYAVPNQDFTFERVLKLPLGSKR